MSIKNEALSQQANFFKLRGLKKKMLKTRLGELKGNYSENLERINDLERELSNLAESEIRDEISVIKKFEQLNNEKMTPYFLKLAKESLKSPELDVIRDQNGETFSGQQERENHITNFYKELYSEPRKGVEITQKDIENFLGNTVEEDDIKASKLTTAEKEDLDRPLAITEFDDAVKQTKKTRHRESMESATVSLNSFGPT